MRDRGIVRGPIAGECCPSGGHRVTELLGTGKPGARVRGINRIEGKWKIDRVMRFEPATKGRCCRVPGMFNSSEVKVLYPT